MGTSISLRQDLRIDSRFLEPACGSGNFLVKILRRKLAAVEIKYGKSDFERRHYALLAVMCIYGIELLHGQHRRVPVNVLEGSSPNLQNLDDSDELYRAGCYVLSARTSFMGTRSRCARTTARRLPLRSGAT